MEILTDQQLRRLLLRRIISVHQYIYLKPSNKKEVMKRYERRRFNLEIDVTKEDSVSYFRFTEDEIRMLKRRLRIPTLCVTTNCLSLTGLEGLCKLLRRLCYPNRLADLVKLFNTDESTLSRIFQWMLNLIYSNFNHLMTSLNQKWLSKPDLNKYAEVCFIAGTMLPNICSFMDGTCRSICRPSVGQKNQYSGYKKMHCIKFQSIVFPNRLIGRLDEPYNGRRHDAAILNLSGLVSETKRSL